LNAPPNPANSAPPPGYLYGDIPRHDLLRLIPKDGTIVGSVGCGTGMTEYELVKQGRLVHGVDVDPAAVEVAKSRLTSARVVPPSERAPFERESLDGLILADVIEHIPLAWEALSEFVKMVKPGGWVVISVPNMRYVEAVVRFVVLGDWPERPVGIFDQTHVQVMTHRRLKRWIKAAGLRPERWFTRYFPQGVRRVLGVAGNWVTLGVFRHWFMFQIQVVCRRL
jgi:SAM-dependent methyltransferase